MRVIAGTYGGRRLHAPSGRGTRPTSDRVREALFSSLSDRITGAVVLDLYSGSGALAIESLSRGASEAALVEHDRAAAATARRNLAELRITAEQARVWEMSAESFCHRPPAGPPYDIVLLDPPYEVGLATLSDRLDDLVRAQRLASDPVVVVERDRRDPLLAGDGVALSFLVEERRRTYGDTVLLYLRDQEPEP